MSIAEIFAGFATEVANPLPRAVADQDRLQLILTTVFSILAATALLVIVIAGLRYVNSTGDAGTLSKLKNTIIYASVGLIVSMIAVAMVSFVLGRL